MMKRALLATTILAWALSVRSARAQPADEHATAEAIVQSFAHDAAHAKATADALREAKDALERATRLRVAGDEAHAKAADGLALEWAETARDLSRAADAETRAADLRRQALEAQAQLERSRALVEEAVASIGRLRTELEQAERDAARGHDSVAVEVHDGDSPASKKKAAKKAAAKKDTSGTP